MQGPKRILQIFLQFLNLYRVTIFLQYKARWLVAEVGTFRTLQFIIPTFNGEYPHRLVARI
jgi:hypothetical protein